MLAKVLQRKSLDKMFKEAKERLNMSHLTPSQSVQEFYRKFDQERWLEKDQPNLEGIESRGRLRLKVDLIAEEFFELIEATFSEEASNSMRDSWENIFFEGLDKNTNGEWNRDIIETADALADLLYVIYGMALETGIPLDDVFDEVHRSNMSKLDENGRPILADGITPKSDGTIPPKGKILKGEGYFKPDIQGVLF